MIPLPADVAIVLGVLAVVLIGCCVGMAHSVNREAQRTRIVGRKTW